MAETLKDRVQACIDRLQAGPVTLATAAGLERTFISDILKGKKRSVGGDKLPALARALGTSVEYLTFLTNDPAPDAGGLAERLAPDVDFAQAERAPPLHRFGGPRDVPEFGAAAGGRNGEGDFRFNGQIVDRAPRPPGIMNRKDVYALRVTGESMYPKFEEGDRIYVDPHRPPRVMDYVVVELHPTQEGEAGAGYVKRLVKKTPTKVVVQQFNPSKELEFDLDTIKSLHRVIPQDELLGM